MECYCRHVHPYTKCNPWFLNVQHLVCTQGMAIGVWRGSMSFASLKEKNLQAPEQKKMKKYGKKWKSPVFNATSWKVPLKLIHQLFYMFMYNMLTNYNKSFKEKIESEECEPCKFSKCTKSLRAECF